MCKWIGEKYNVRGVKKRTARTNKCFAQAQNFSDYMSACFESLLYIDYKFSLFCFSMLDQCKAMPCMCINGWGACLDMCRQTALRVIEYEGICGKAK